jgi:hypothetical protein
MGKSKLEIHYTFFQPQGKYTYTGANVLYSQYKRNSYVLLDISSLEKNNNKLLIISNNKNFIDKYNSVYTVLSNRSTANVKYKISKYLTSVFCALPIKKHVRDRYFCRIRTLLLEKFVSINDRLKKSSDNNRETKTYICFSYKYFTWYFGFHIPCCYCKTLCAVVMSNNRTLCAKCKLLILEIPKPPIKLFTLFSFYQNKRKLVTSQ